MTPPPPAEQLASRIFLGPALRTQPDRRLVTLVREGYETAFEEIVRRYRRPLDRFAASFVGGRSEDVTQDAFSKALLALRGSEAEIELRPWLYRIVRNTALNDLRDRPPRTEELGEALPGGRSAAAEAERREEMTELIGRLQALPEPQRAAIVMRELEGLSHEEIAASLGLTGGAARQVIFRARQTLRGGFGMLVPLPLLRTLFDHTGETAAAGAGGAVAVAGSAAGAGGAGATLGGLGAGATLKVGLATALIAGSVGAGVALEHGHGVAPGREVDARSAAALPVDAPQPSGNTAGLASGFGNASPTSGEGRRQTRSGPGSGDRGQGGGRDGGGRDDRRGSAGEDPDESGDDLSHGGGPHSGGSSGHSGRGSDDGGRGGGGENSSGSGTSAGSPSGRSGSGDSEGGDGGSSGGSGETSRGNDGGGGPGEPAPVATAPPVEEATPESDGSGSGGGPGSPSGDSGSGGGSGSSGSGGGGESDL